MRKLSTQLGNRKRLRICYEAGPTGYGLYRLFTSMDIACEVTAPSLIPHKPGERVKTDRRDAIRLAQLYRAGELTSVHVPTEEDEALRDLVRVREDAKEDTLRAKQRLISFLTRYDQRPPKGTKRWSKDYRHWLNKLTFKNAVKNRAFQEYLTQVKLQELRLQEMDKEIEEQAKEGYHAPMIQALKALRGVATISATGLVAEIGCFKRFSTPRQLMAYAGLVPSEYSSGETRKQGSITKTGNRHVRSLLILNLPGVTGISPPYKSSC
ncbi:IS110 family transposase [Fictibacillus sp. NRS-1165]|uniref:IS110 family transposase n=1 Tax=Fictibacillus sp. NRS-1165 TaxID=3144463 RepID=UPI003D1CB60A